MSFKNPVKTGFFVRNPTPCLIPNTLLASPEIVVKTFAHTGDGL
jgi:hypothetical protein